MRLETKTGEKQRKLIPLSRLCAPEASKKTKGKLWIQLHPWMSESQQCNFFLKTSTAMAVTAILVAPALILMCMNKSVVKLSWQLPCWYTD